MKTRFLDWFFRLTLILALGLLAVPPADTFAAAPGQAGSSASTLADPLNVLSIPVTTKPPTLDGFCDQAEYGSAAAYLFDDGGGSRNGVVHLMHDENFLYVCMSGENGTLKERFTSLYLDPQGDGVSYTFAKANDYSLRAMIEGGALSSWHGSGIGPYPDAYLEDFDIGGSWTAQTSSTQGDQAEYRLALKGFNFNACGAVFGMAVYHHWFSGVGNDYGWPSNNWYDQPRTWQLVTLDRLSSCGASGQIAYVFRGDTLSATSFYNLLAGAGYTVTLIPLDKILDYDFTTFDLTIIADDTGSLNNWGSGGSLTTDQVNQIKAVSASKPGGTPVLGIGEGGYAFFGKLGLFIGWPQGWHGPQKNVNRGPDPLAPYIFDGIAAADPVPYIESPANSVGIYLSSKPANVFEAGLEDPLDEHASIITQDCRMLWGNSSSPLGFDSGGNGAIMFLNAVGFMKGFQCSPPADVPTQCSLSITKSDNLAAGSQVQIGDTITYKVNYSLGTDAVCPTGKVVDVIPAGTTFIPGSATAGVTPAPDGTLTWSVAQSGSVSFSVLVDETACATGADIRNTADLRPSAGPILTSAPPITHPVACQVVSFPTDQPLYAESEFKVDPYPLMAGESTQLSVRVRNLTADPQPVTVQFQTSPAVFGIGLNYSTPLGSSSAVVPASGYSDVGIDFVPTLSGIACVQAVVTAANGSAPLVSQSCLDVTEVLTPGVTADLTFPVRNNTSSAGDIALVVDNTCPGWTAVLSAPPGGIYVNLGGGATGAPLATLSVTPPAGGLLGTRCHIDVQAWKGSQLIGGIRKVDIAPLHLPFNVEPPWEESEISLVPDPPQVGVPGQICVRLINPLPYEVKSGLSISVADFGAGIGFTPAGGIGVYIPSGVSTQCIDWTPAPGGTLHRCVLVTLYQNDYLEQTSQRNIDVLPASTTPTGLVVPFHVGNPDLVSHTLTFDTSLVGVDPLWQPIIEPLGGGVLPASLGAGGQLSLQLRFGLVKGAAPLNLVNFLAPPLADPAAGETHSVQVTVLLDGEPAGGFTVQVDPFRSFLPALLR